ncbi:MAG: iron ABC transporter permease [Melioribacteraceae bacterium]|nr:iron ABC transporter permease [Melioribacteraceae bacterium]
MAFIKRLTVFNLVSISFFLLTALVCTVFIALSIGSVNIPIPEIFNSIFGNEANEVNHRIITELRLPRIILAVAVGGGLSVAGVVFQSILLNPLAEPYILGVSSGGTFGAVFALFLGLTFWGQQLFAFTGALMVIMIVYSLGRRGGTVNPNTLLLSGVMTGAFFSALILFFITFVDGSFRSALFWLLGNLSLAQSYEIWIVFPIVIILSAILFLFSNRLNLLSLGDETADHLGINSKSTRKLVYLFSSLLVGAVVSISGIVGFVGLLVPHSCRIIFGTDNRLLIPASFFVGSIFLIFSDLLARTLISPSELPVGVITAVVGAPVFIYLLKSQRSFPV